MPTTVARGRIRAGSQQGNHSVDGREEPYVVNCLEERGIGRLVELRSIATQIQCDIWHASQDAVRLTEECGGCTDELWAFAKCGLKAAAEQQCGVPDCNFMFPDPGDDCNEGDCKKQCDSSDGAAATGLGFLTAAAAAVAAL